MALHYAVRNKLLNEIRVLVEGGIDVNGQDKNGRIPLMICCIDDDETFEAGVARMLLQSGAKVGKVDKDGRNCLMLASIFGRNELMGLFLKAVDFDCNKKDNFGNTVLHYASLAGKAMILSNLLYALGRSKVNVNARNNFGQTAASLAKKAGNEECVNVFKSKIPEADFRSKTPDELLIKPWSKDLRYIQNPLLMLEQAEKDIASGINIYKSRSDFNIHQFRRGRQLPKDLMLKKKRNNEKRNFSNFNKNSWNKKRPNLQHNMKERSASYAVKTSSSSTDVSWKLIVPDFMNMLRVQVSPSYRPTATPIPQNYEDIFKPMELPDSNTLSENDECCEKTPQIGQDRRRSAACLRTKVKPEFYDTFANQSSDTKRRGRKFSDGTLVLQRSKTSSKLL